MEKYIVYVNRRFKIIAISHLFIQNSYQFVEPLNVSMIRWRGDQDGEVYQATLRFCSVGDESKLDADYV